MKDEELVEIWDRATEHFTARCQECGIMFRCIEASEARDSLSQGRHGFNRMVLVFEIREGVKDTWGALSVWHIRDNEEWSTLEEYMPIGDDPHTVKSRAIFGVEHPLQEGQDISEWLSKSLKPTQIGYGDGI